MAFLKPKQNYYGEKPKFWRKKSTKIGLWVFGILILAFLIWFFGAYSLASKMFTTNLSGGSSLLKLFGKNSTQLKGEGDGRINVVLTGIGGANHPGGALTDSIMVVSIDPSNKTMAMLSIPRDLFVKTKNYSGGKINEIYSQAEKKKKGTGGQAVKDAIGEILDLPIHYFVNVDFQGFVKFVDTLGGVTIDVDKPIYDPEYPAADMIRFDPLVIKAGSQKMNGELVLKYSRSRHGTSGGDFDRARRQQQVLQAIQEKALSIGFLANPKKVLDTMSILGNHVNTDFSTTELERLMSVIKDLDRSKTVNKVFSDAAGGELYPDSTSGTFYLYPKGNSYSALQKIAHEIFTDPDLKRENAKIEILNGSKTAGQALTLAETLKSYGYNIVNIEKTDSVEKTIIYDYDNGSMKNTLDFLKTRLNANVVKKTKTAKTTVDIGIVIGNNYQEKSGNLKESP